jgi:hypothetical protein
VESQALRGGLRRPDLAEGVRRAERAAQLPGDAASSLLATTGDHILGLYAFQPTDPFPPPLYQVPVDVKPFADQADADQQPNADITKPRRVNLGSNLFKGELVRSVFRNGQLYGLMPECTQWPDASECMTSIRLWRVDPLAHTVSIDRSFGQRGPGDASGALVSYGWPMFEVNKDGTMVVGYQRSGTTVFPEARFSVRFDGDADMRPSFVLHKGSYPLGKQLSNPPTEDELKPAGRLDLTGAGVDGFDDLGVWLLQAYSKKNETGSGVYQLVVGKVFGAVHPDVWVLKNGLQVSTSAGKKITGKKRRKVLAAGAAIDVAGSIGNQGDGRAAAVQVTALLLPAGARAAGIPLGYEIGQDSLGTVKSGKLHAFSISGSVPDGVPAGKYRVQILAETSTTPEYDVQNNSRLGSPTLNIG